MNQYLIYAALSVASIGAGAWGALAYAKWRSTAKERAIAAIEKAVIELDKMAGAQKDATAVATEAAAEKARLESLQARVAALHP